MVRRRKRRSAGESRPGLLVRAISRPGGARHAARRTLARWRAAVSDPGARWLIRGVFSVALAVALAYVPYHLLDGSGARRAARLRVERAHITEQADAIEADNRALRHAIDALKHDPAAVEDIARDELGMVRAGELVIRVRPAADDANGASGAMGGDSAGGATGSGDAAPAPDVAR